MAGRTVANRFVLQPMEGCDGTLDGAPGELTFRRWQRFAAGGAAILWGEATAVRADGRANVRQIVLAPHTYGVFARLLEHARRARKQAFGPDGFLIGVQLTHSGRYAQPAFTGASDEQLDRLQDDYVNAAGLAARAGADFVDVKQCHGYLLNELLGARRRPGRYGGSLENRTRFAREVIRRIRDDVPELFVATRMNVFDGVAFGGGAQRAAGFGCDPASPEHPDLREPLEAVSMFVEAGAELVNVTAGCPYTNPHVGRPADRPPVDGYPPPEPGLVGVARHFALTEAVQHAFPHLAVVGTGYSYLRQFLAEAAEGCIRDGRTSLAGVGRGAIAYPDFVRDIIQTGAMDGRKVCMTVSHCTTLMRSKGGAVGQYAAGCVPRDPVYARLLQDARREGVA